jgi:hypothetical protein
MVRVQRGRKKGGRQGGAASVMGRRRRRKAEKEKEQNERERHV